MKASVVDLRYKMNEVLKALERNEAVTVLYHGKVKGTIVPARKDGKKRMTEHPFFGMSVDQEEQTVLAALNDLRQGRYGDL